MEAWLFIWTVTVFDCLYVLFHRDSFASWELNPLACWLGADLAVIYRFASVGLAFLLIRSVRPATQRWATALLTMSHLALLFWYILALA